MPQAPEENHNRRNWNPEGIGRNMTDSLKILNLPMNASNNEIKKQFRRLSLTYHPDRYSPMLGILEKKQPFIFKFSIIQRNS
jgi:preprotein translocase subunit Sec63